MPKAFFHLHPYIPIVANLELRGKVFTFKVALLGVKGIYRIIDIRGDQTLDRLHKCIFQAFDRYDEHLYSFYITRKATSSIRAIYNAPEFAHPMHAGDKDALFSFEKAIGDAAKTKIGDIGLGEKEKMYYLFDFGDDWWHEITCAAIAGPRPGAKYPVIIKKVGDSPDQYPEAEE
jgi:hypothetical protein